MSTPGRRVLGAALALLALGGPARADTVQSGPFTFTLPAGWRDVSPGVAPSKLAGVPQQLIQRARASGASVIAFDLNGASDGFIENVNVRITGCIGQFTAAKVKEVAEGMRAKFTGAGGGPKLTPIESGTMTIGGVRCGRIVQDLDQGALKVRQLSVHLPSGKQCAIVTYSAARDAFDGYLPIFEAALRATKGLREAEGGGFWSRIFGSAGRGAVIGGIAGGLAVLLLGLFKWLRRGKG